MSFKYLDALLEEGAPSPPSRTSRPPERRPVVLIIDDDSSIREALHLLMSGRYELILCASAKEGVAAFNREVSAVVLDVKMEIYDGFWACDELRKLQADIPIIFYSAYQDAKDPYQIINQHRPFGYIVKDGNPKRLLDTLDTAVRLYQSAVRSRRIIDNLKRKRKGPG